MIRKKSYKMNRNFHKLLLKEEENDEILLELLEKKKEANKKYSTHKSI